MKAARRDHRPRRDASWQGVAGVYTNRVTLTTEHNNSRHENQHYPHRADNATRPRRADPAHCFLNVHGLHHSGTGYLRETIWGLFPTQASTHHFLHHVPQVKEMEGYHATDVYPDIGKRTEAGCNVNVTAPVAASLASWLLAAYTCPANMAVVTAENKRKLLNDWMLGWNESSTLLIQKTYVCAKTRSTGAVCKCKCKCVCVCVRASPPSSKSSSAMPHFVQQFNWKH